MPPVAERLPDTEETPPAAEECSDLYRKMLSHTQIAVVGGGVIQHLLWYQGEVDAHLPAANEYKTRFQQFVSDFQNNLMLHSLPVIEIQMATELNNVECIDAMWLQLGPNYLHLTTAAQLQLGKKLADAYLSIRECDVYSQQLQAN
ncbi:hypothetical protein ACS0TY_014138 [Phlomoides rotata]